jgi:S1-C subfamily serine protease
MHDADSPAPPLGDLPPSFCQGAWRQSVVLLGLGATIVLAISLGSYSRAQSGAGWVGEAMAAPAKALAAPPMAAALVGQGRGAAPSTGDANMRLVSTGQRTAFNRAATAIRPSVVGIRVKLAQPEGRLGSERLGSGVVVDSAGYAVTCRHVVVGAESIMASRFREPQRWLAAQLVAVEGDLALVRILDQAPFSPAALGDSEQVQVGDWVLAAGHPFALGLTVTAGIVGQRHATLTSPGGGQYIDLLQTDAPINEGSSGGPLINTDGQVVGLNTAIYSPNGAFSGAGFAIPSNRVRQFLAGSLGSGPPAGGGIAWGVGLVDVTPSLAAGLGYTGPGGAMVNSVVPRSPADLAGLVQGDVIVAVSGQPVADIASLDRLRGQLAGATTIVLQIWRRGRSETRELRTGAARTG